MRAKHWDPASDDLGGLLFEGAPELLRQLDKLVHRPRGWWREALLPIIYLVCERTAKNPLDGLADRLRQAQGVLHSRISGPESPSVDNGQPAEKPIRQLLDGVVVDFSQGRGRGRPLKFPHYSLAVWLASLLMNPPTPDQSDHTGRRVDNELKDFMKKHFRLQNITTEAEINVIDEFPRWVRIPVLLLPPLGIWLMRMFWRPPRWAAKNRIASDHSSGSFRGLARMLMEQDPDDRSHGIQPAEVDRFLVDAFMEDLRRGYRRTTLFGFGRRRTTYPVLLVDKIGSATDGPHLLEIISASRKEYLHRNTAGPGRQPRKHAYFHPLLIIAQGDNSALDKMVRLKYRPEHPEGYPIADITFYYSKWYRALANSEITWFLPLKVKIPTEDLPGGRATLTKIRLPAAPPPVMTFVAAALLIAAASITTYYTYYTHCGAWYWEPQLQRQFLTPDRSQCIGLGSSNYRFFNDVNGVDPEVAKGLKEVEDLLHQANKEAVKNPNYLTVVYLSELSPRDVGIYRSELEQLRGIAVAQHQGSLAGRPIRVLLANGGAEMEHGAAAAEAIAREADEDDTLVAVVGLGSSREGTKLAIARLDRPGTHIPMIATVISATDLTTSSYYHQVSPNNQREAEVSAFYAATQLRAQNVTIYYSNDKKDIFSNDLRDKAKHAFEARGFAVRERPYQFDDSDDINSAGRDACDVDREGIVFYAGRASQLFGFLNGMQGKCQANYPRFLGGDSVSRFVLDGGLNKFPGLIVDYLAQASSLAWGSNCSGVPDSIGFFVVYQELFKEGACESTQRGGSLLAHDTLLVFIQGVRNTGIDRPSPDAVLRGIEDISSQGRGPVLGASGQIDYPRTGNKAIPQDKAILVLRGQAAKDLQLMILCGQFETAEPPDDCRTPSGP